MPSSPHRAGERRAARPRRPMALIASVVVVAGLVGAGAGYLAGGSGQNTYSFQTSNATPGGQVLSTGLTIPTIVGRVAPDVVSVKVESPLEEDQGTGMVITSNGLIVTNNHVIAAAAAGGTITVTRTGYTKSVRAVLVGTDPKDDVALIRAEGISGWSTVTFGNSDKLVTGDSVVAIGNALGLSAGTPTVTAGIVSALGRTVTASDGTNSETLYNMIQTDAAINPGNSGGPLLDSEGQVIGMDTAVAGTLPDGENAQNIGFAIPVDTIKSLLPTLLKGGTVSKSGAYLGVEVETLNASIAQSYGFTQTTGALIVEVLPATAAAAAGFQQGDIIVNIDGTNITSAEQVTKIIKDHHVGQQITVTVIRNGARITLYPKLGTVPN